jgi:hypothetical protein
VVGEIGLRVDAVELCRLGLDNNPAERALRGVATRRSLSPPSSSLWKHWNLIFDIDATRANCSRKRRSHPFVSQVCGSDLVRSSWHDLLGGQSLISRRMR